MALTLNLRFGPNISAAQQAVFDEAAARWSEIIIADLPPVLLDSTPVSGIEILADVKPIDEAGGTLGQAGPTLIRSNSGLPARGIMEFDSADIAALEARGTLDDVIIHEMGHVLGFGTLWTRLNLVDNATPADPRFIGAQAMAVYGELRGAPDPEPVPLANTGGAGTFGAHWREGLFTNELMTGFINNPPNPLSRLTIASMADLGYEVDLARADDYAIANMILRMLSPLLRRGNRCQVRVPETEIVPCDD